MGEPSTQFPMHRDVTMHRRIRMYQDGWCLSSRASAAARLHSHLKIVLQVSDWPAWKWKAATARAATLPLQWQVKSLSVVEVVKSVDRRTNTFVNILT